MADMKRVHCCLVFLVIVLRVLCVCVCANIFITLFSLLCSKKNVNSTASLRELIPPARFARCRSRFVMPVILYQGKVCVMECFVGVIVSINETIN